MMTSVSVKTAYPHEFLWTSQTQPFSPCSPAKRNGAVQCTKLAKPILILTTFFKSWGLHFVKINS